MIFLKSFPKWPRRTSKILLLLTFLLAAFFLIESSYILSKAKIMSGKNKDEAGGFSKKEFEGEKLVHLDLKGAPPKISYLLEFIPYIKRLGATGILIEYEDMFPFHDELQDISALNAYTPSEIATIIQTAEMNNLTVIPLIQTFGHFEFVLKLERYKELREVENNPQVLCPNHKNVSVLLKKMIDQVLEAHKTSKYLHLGCDEVGPIGVCERCITVLKEKRWRKDYIYFNYVREIVDYLNKSHPGVRPIIWGDKFNAKNEKIILLFEINQFVEVMMWNYSPEENFFPTKNDMLVLKRLFTDIWIASAFKGATGNRQIIPNTNYYIQNSKGWMKFVKEWKTQINFRGIAVTGWQRYHHFDVLCELLPVGIPSLALNLQYLNMNKREVFNYEVKQRCLKCNKLLPVNPEESVNLMLLTDLKCEFPGFQVYLAIHLFYNVLLRLETSLAGLKSGRLLFYNIVQNSTNPAFVNEWNINLYERHLLEVNDYREDIRDAMKEVYDEYTINEWILTYLMPAQLQLEAGINILNNIREMKVWPRRPYVGAEMEAKRLFDFICTRNKTMGCVFFNIR